MASERQNIRAAIEFAMKAITKNVWHYRLRAFDLTELPAVNILPLMSEDDDSNFKTVFRRSEQFRIEVLLARKSDVEDFAAVCDQIYEASRRALLNLKFCNVSCPKTTIVRRTWATDESGSTPILVIKFGLNVEFDESD